MVKGLSRLANIHYIRQNELVGLDHAVYCTKSFGANEPFAVLLGDDIVRSQVPALKQISARYWSIKARRGPHTATIAPARKTRLAQ